MREFAGSQLLPVVGVEAGKSCAGVTSSVVNHCISIQSQDSFLALVGFKI